ncbi:hypothetical protein EGI22_11065 [Lacihabitans sp. LS3-19]|uniref:hypothetical protein n=1 Tax=Lacihabitans sp. LS3-19 TaxID=2487335 RepID=UPI0020CFD054|nr:hypothetical protein [Lacihabitans sp. LS3-19]MCP9768455.1 hypothetical protein [Lacihabitans sp. LS3-19]
MIYTFSDSFFDKSEVDITVNLDKLWHNIKDRHDLYLSNFEAIKSSNWYIGLRGSSQKELENLFIKSANIPKKSSKMIISNSCDDDSYSISEAEIILTTPLKIILENIEYDSYFLDAIISCYPKWGQKIKEQQSKGWIEYINGGGESISNVVVILKARFEEQKENFPKDSHRYVRAFILLDSDKKYPNDPTIKPLHTAVSESYLPYYVLKKREKENYLPNEIFDEIENNENFIQAIKRLTPIQLDFFDLEDGLPDKNFNQLDQNLQNLYSSIPENDRRTLRKEKLIFYKISGKKDSFKARFSQLFLSGRVTRENLEKRANSTGKDELEQILLKIHELL